MSEFSEVRWANAEHSIIRALKMGTVILFAPSERCQDYKKILEEGIEIGEYQPS